MLTSICVPRVGSRLLQYTALMACAVIVGTDTAAAQATADSKVIPANANHRGQSYAEWSAGQWQWLFSQPVDEHPLFETADCSAGQSGRVWYLGGTFASLEIAPGVILGEADRSCTIPSGTSLFFPLIDVECSALEGDGETEAELRECANFLADFIVPATVFLTIDGKPVTNTESLRVESPLFTIGPLPDNNVFQLFGLDAPEGTTTSSVSDGFFAMVKPLSVGKHTLHFGGVTDVTSIGGPVFIQNIRYEINVVPRGKYD
jgi:hypothetical protein